MKWNNNDVIYARGDYTPVIFRFDNSTSWLQFEAICSTGGIKSSIRKLGQHYGAKNVEVKYKYDDDYRPVEPDIIGVIDNYDSYRFQVELPVPEGTRRQFKVYEETEIFPEGAKHKEKEHEER